ncbi:ABC transporter permease [Amycolatopsis sp. NPDC059021]|uniref:ABC transporter permease n=1 Tax=Amycolatopsis sp. NPDC059021 TaxID=3346704 RepID=UPI00366D0C33
MLTNVRAELAKQSRRPATWLLLAIAVVLTLTFGYVIPFAGLNGRSGAPGSGRGLAAMLPEAVVGSTLGGLPVFVGALALVFGVLVAGSEYGFGTWKTVLAQRPSRATVHGAKTVTVTVAVGTLLGVLALFASTSAASAVVASVENQPMHWPGAADLLIGVGAGWLVTTMWGMLGVLLAVGLRSVALPIGLGLVWLLAVQNLLASIAAPLLDWVAQLQKVLPGPNAGALAAALGANAGTPGVGQIVGAGQATAVVAGYLVVFGVVSGWLLHQRDIA